MEELIPLAPLHNPPALAGVRAVAERLPGVPQVGVFDTAFHRTLPAEASTYALPRWCEERHGVRKYGFHGTSHQSAARRAAELLGKPPGAVNVVTLHLGNGCSAAAVAGGVCVDTSMGFTPLAGLVMGTRSGDLDPAAVLHLQREAGLSVDDADRLLNRESGLKGLCGDNDVRRVLEREAAGDRDAALALAVYCRRIRKTVGAYFAVLGSVDAVVFTAGVGENGPDVRARVCDPLGGFGVALDPAANAAAVGREARVDAGDPVAVLVVPAEEEREIARQARGVVGGAGRPYNDRMSDPKPADAPPAPPPADADGLPPLPKPEELTKLSDFFGILRGRMDFEETLAEIRRERDEWDEDDADMAGDD